GFVLRKVIMEGCLQRGFKPKIAFEGMDMDAVKGLVSAGLGVTLIPEVTLVDCLPRSTVKVKVTDPELQRTVGVTIPKERSLLPREQLFYEFIQGFFTRIEYFQQEWSSLLEKTFGSFHYIRAMIVPIKSSKFKDKVGGRK